MKIGDLVKVIEPYNGFPCDVTGKIISFYKEGRVIIKTSTGNTWALKKNELKKI